MKDHHNPKEKRSLTPLEEDMRDNLIHEINDMARFAFSRGKLVNVTIQGLDDIKNIDELAKIHAKLSKIVWPATPSTIRYSHKVHAVKRRNRFSVTHPLIRQQLLLAGTALVVFILTGITPYVNAYTVESSLEQTQGFSEFIVLLFLSSLALLGVVFSKFRAVVKAIKNASASEGDSSYITLLSIIGIISGVTFSKVVNIESMGYDHLFLAFLGGFSTETLRDILSSILGRVKCILGHDDTHRPLRE